MTCEYADHFDFYTRGPYSKFVKETRSAGSDPIQMIHARHPEGDFSDPAHKDMMLVQVLRASAPITRDFGEGRLRVNYRFSDFDLQARNSASEVLAEGDHELRMIVLPFFGIRKIVQDKWPNFDGSFGRLHAAPFRDFFLEQLCQRLWVESEAGNPTGNLFADGALISIAATLLRLKDGVSAVEPDSAVNPLAGRLKIQIEEFIDAHLDQNFTVRDLAFLASQPEATFAKAFKSEFGQTPHRYVVSRRIARAQELLAIGDMALSEIAYSCGFASQSHMTDVVRNKLGVTPGRYRKEVRG